MRYFIIEHPTRGIVKEFDPDARDGVRFTQATMRTDESVHRFFHISEAMVALAKIGDRTREQCKIVSSPTDDEYEWKAIL